MAYSFEDAVEQILQKNDDYPADAYFFIRAALDATVEKCRKPAENPHLSAEELYFGFCAYALEEYGPLAQAVMEQWNVLTSSDVGNLVYNLIEVGVFGKQEGDRREQFDNLTPVDSLLNAPYETLDTPN
jgi:uncharacterized repeat protein (TIGR04138 family)